MDALPVNPVMAYRYKAELLAKDYLLDVPYAAVLAGILMCKLAYDFTRFISSFHYKGYASLTKMQKVEWNNRGMSTVHAIFITVMSVYFVFFSGIFSDQLDGPITSRSSSLSSFALGVSIGYFITDVAMIYWFYPSLGGMEYVIHHILALMSTVYALVSGEAHLYIYMGLITETTTPGINLRWFLDAAGMKNSKAYLVNGAAMVVTWLVNTGPNRISFDLVASIIWFLTDYFKLLDYCREKCVLPELTKPCDKITKVIAVNMTNQCKYSGLLECFA